MATPILSTDPLDALVDQSTGDIALGPETNWEVPLASGGVGIAQLIAIAVRLFLNEWFLNLDEGMSWFQEFLGEKYDEQLLRRRLADRIVGVPGVNVITSLVIVFDASTRAASVDYVVETDFGDTLEGSLSLPVGG